MERVPATESACYLLLTISYLTKLGHTAMGTVGNPLDHRLSPAIPLEKASLRVSILCSILVDLDI